VRDSIGNNAAARKIIALVTAAVAARFAYDGVNDPSVAALCRWRRAAMARNRSAQGLHKVVGLF
jgi:hypothetical protein